MKVQLNKSNIQTRHKWCLRYHYIKVHLKIKAEDTPETDDVTSTTILSRSSPK